jgi:hypothetical protein
MARDFLTLDAGSNRGAPVTDANPVPVKIISGGGGGGSGTEYTQDAAAPANPVGGALQLMRDDTLAAVGADGDWVTARSNAKGELSVQDADSIAALGVLHTDLTATVTELPKTPLLAATDFTYVFDSSSASTERSLVGATASQTTKGYAMIVTAAAATTFTFTDGSAGTVLYTLEFPAAGAYVLDPVERPYFKTTASTALYVKSSNAVKTTVGLRHVKGA